MRKLRFGTDAQESKCHALTVGIYLFLSALHPTMFLGFPAAHGTTKHISFSVLSRTFHKARWYVECLLPERLCYWPLSRGSSHFRSENLFPTQEPPRGWKLDPGPYGSPSLLVSSHAVWPEITFYPV